MAFENLSFGLGFSCLDEFKNQITDDFINSYIRGVNHQQVCIHSFNTSEKDGRQLQHDRPSRRIRCMLRTVSVSFFKNNHDQIRAYFKNAEGISPKWKFEYFCIFRIDQSAKIWDTGNAGRPAHRSLIKSDAFGLDDMQLIQIVRAEDF